MPKIWRALMITIGGLLVAVGAVTAIIVGPDNTVTLPTNTLKLGNAQAVTTTPEVLAMRHTTLVVEAKATGRVFVGAAHPIDATDYMQAMPSLKIWRVDQHGVQADQFNSASRPYAGPVGLDFWTSATEGSGAQRLALNLDGQPTQLVLMPLDKSASLLVTWGFRIAHLFAAALVAIALGVLLVLASVLLKRRRRVDAVDSQTEPQDSERRGTPVGLTVRQAASVALAVGLLPVATGCAVVEVPASAATWQVKALTKPALANQEAAQAMLDDYDKRNNVWIHTPIARRDAKAWTNVDTGPTLALDRYSDAYEKATGDKQPSDSMKSKNLGTYIPTCSSYPMYVIARRNWQPVAENKSSPEDSELRIMIKEHADQPWMMWGGIDDGGMTLGKPLPSDQTNLTDAENKKIAAIAEQAGRAVSGGSSTITLMDSWTKYRADMVKITDKTTSAVTFLATPWGEGNSFTPTISGKGPLHAVHTSDGLLAVATYSAQRVYFSKPGFVHNWLKPESVIYNDAAPHDILIQPSVVTLLIEVKTGGKPDVIAWQHTLVK